MPTGSHVFLRKLSRALLRKTEAFVGNFYPLDRTLRAMSLRPFELHLELTNLCNANCIFCPYQFQIREHQFMSAEVFYKAIADFTECGGGSVGLTPIVGDALIDPKFLERVRYIRAQDRIDRIWLTTNGILLDKHGIDEILESGLTSITISTSGFQEESYREIYRSTAYQRMRSNVLALLQLNSQRNHPIPITIGFRSNRRLNEIMRDPDFLPMLDYEPQIDFTWSFTSANGRITRGMLPQGMNLRTVSIRKEPCVQLFNGPIVLPDGTVMACSCVAAVDALDDLGIGNIMAAPLLDLWKSEQMKQIRAGFGSAALNKTCASCDMYRDLELYRTSEGRKRAQMNQDRADGKFEKRPEPPAGAFSGG